MDALPDPAGPCRTVEPAARAVLWSTYFPLIVNTAPIGIPFSLGIEADVASPSDPPTGRAGDTEQFPVARTGAHAAAEPADAPPTGGPAHAVGSDSGAGISRAGWWAITIGAAVLLILGFLLTFGPARYWTPVPVVFLGYFLISGLIGLVFWKGVRELRDSNPTLHSGDGPASPGARVAAAIGAVGIASALIMLPVGLSDAPASAAPCPDGSNTCGPQPTMGPQPTQGNGGNTTAPQAPNTTVPGYTPPDTPPQQGNGSTPTVQGQVPTMPTGDSPSNGCIFNCGPTQAPQAPQTGQATPPQTAQNPVTTAPNAPATTPQAPTTTPRLRTPTPETTTSTSSSKARDRDDDQQRSSDEDREKNSGTPYQAAEIAALAGTYRRKKTSDAVRDGQVVSEYATQVLKKGGDVVPGRVVNSNVKIGGIELPNTDGFVSIKPGDNIDLARHWDPSSPDLLMRGSAILKNGTLRISDSFRNIGGSNFQLINNQIAVYVKANGTNDWVDRSASLGAAATPDGRGIRAKLKVNTGDQVVVLRRVTASWLVKVGNTLVLRTASGDSLGAFVVGEDLWSVPQAAVDKIPKGWSFSANNSGVGYRWFGPKNSAIRIDKGTPGVGHSSQHVDHVRVTTPAGVLGRDGKVIPPTAAQPKPASTADAHIPLSEWLKWASWDSPTPK